MTKIIDDFLKSGLSVDGYGFFKGDAAAVFLSSTIGKNQKRKCLRYGEIPAAFYLYLKRKKVLPVDAKIPKQGDDRKLDAFLNFLAKTSYEDEKARDAAEYLRKCILKDELPMLRKSFW